MKSAWRRVVLATVVLAGLAGVGSAEVVTVRLSGRITEVFDASGGLYATVAVGTRFVGTYVYDTTTPNTSAWPWMSGEYWHQAPTVGSLRIAVGSAVFETDPATAQVVVSVSNANSPMSSDTFVVRSLANKPAGSTQIDSIDLEFSDPAGTALVSNALSVDAPKMSDWPSATLRVAAGNPRFEM